MNARFSAWVEADPVQCARIRKEYPFLPLAECAASDKNELITLHRFSISGCNSILPQADPEPNVVAADSVLVSAKPIDDIVTMWPMMKYELLVLDIQGAELKALRGAKKFLAQPSLKYVYTECYAEPKYYAGACTIEELTIELAQYGFEPVAIDPENGLVNNFLFKR